VTPQAPPASLIALSLRYAFALLTFAVSVIAVPMMLDRRVDGVAAALTSLRAFAADVPAMIVWAALIVVVIAAGFARVTVGLVVAVPLVGHAAWHAYRELVQAEP
jgi:uncharacterized membrane protein